MRTRIIVMAAIVAAIAIVSGFALAGRRAHSPTTATQGRPNASAHLDQQTAARLWVRCMRRRGIPEADPGQVNPPNIPPHSSPIYQRAATACHPYLIAREGGAQQAAQDQTKFRTGMLRWAGCIRAHGVPMPDPTFDTHGGADLTLPPGYSYSPPDARFVAASDKCRAYNPKGSGRP